MSLAIPWQLLLAITLLSTIGACGTLFYPERRGQIPGQIDPAIAAMNAIGVLFYVIPGLIAFAIDFSTGAIYLPGRSLQPGACERRGQGRQIDNQWLKAIIEAQTCRRFSPRNCSCLWPSITLRYKSIRVSCQHWLRNAGLAPRVWSLMSISPEHARLMRLASGAALAVALSLALAKALAWWMSGSVSLLAGLTDSLLDRRSVAAQPAGRALCHSAGRRRPSLWPRQGRSPGRPGSGAFIGVSALLVGVQAIHRLLHPEPLGAPLLGIAVMLLSLLLTAALLLLQQHVIRQTGSPAIRADSLHYRSDLLLNSSILLALALAAYGWEELDALFGLAIAGYILWSALGIARDSVAVLMDEELPPEVSQHMHALAIAVPGVQGAHDLRTRVSGSHWYVQLHLELPGQLPLEQAHALCVAVEQAITQAYPRAEVLVHADPV